MHMPLYYILLGIIQGATEFLPVSSSGHLVVAQKLFGYEKAGILVDISLHFGTLVAILIVFRSELWQLFKDTVRGLFLLLRRQSLDQLTEDAPLFYAGVAVIIGTLPAGAVGVMLKETIENFFVADLPVTGAFLLLTGLLLLASRFAPAERIERVGPLRGFLIGVAQALALLPGVSRSGTTIVAGYYLGVNRDAAARFSFLLAVPAIAGAMVLESVDVVNDPASYTLTSGRVVALLLGMCAAAGVGWICLVSLLKIVKRGQLHWFAAYCIPVGCLLLATGLL